MPAAEGGRPCPPDTVSGAPGLGRRGGQGCGRPPHGMGFARVLAGIVTALVLATGCSGSAAGVAPRSSRDVRLASVASLHMVGTRSGWAFSNRYGVLRTRDGARHWRQVSPAVPQPERLADASFLGRRHAWALGLVPDHKVTVYRTGDGGRTWRASRPVPIRFGDGGASLRFLDAAHGWLTVRSAGMGTLQEQIFATDDGGLRWHLIAQTAPPAAPVPPGTLPGSGSLRFATPQLGWFAALTRGAGAGRSRGALYATRDGGHLWRSAPLPAGGRAVTQLGKPWLFGASDVLVPAELATPRGARGDLFVSADGGSGWVRYALPVVPRAVSFTDRSRGWVLGGTRLFRTTDGGRRWTQLRTVPHYLAGARLDFIHRRFGWLTVGALHPAIWRTGDAGRRWRRIRATLRVAAPHSGA